MVTDLWCYWHSRVHSLKCRATCWYLCSSCYPTRFTRLFVRIKGTLSSKNNKTGNSWNGPHRASSAYTTILYNVRKRFSLSPNTELAKNTRMSFYIMSYFKVCMFLFTFWPTIFCTAKNIIYTSNECFISSKKFDPPRAHWQVTAPFVQQTAADKCSRQS